MSILCTRIKEWLRSMGYDDDIPESLNKICSPSTAFIWEQIISNVKPKQDVATVRKNIIIHRLRGKPLEEQHEFNYPIKEIEALLKKRDLEMKVTILENSIEEKETVIDDLLKKNKMTYVVIGNIKGKIRENIEKKYLLEQKYKMLEEDISRAQEVLNLAQNLTPVEMEETPDARDITETLQKCADKLRELTQQIPSISDTANTSQMNRSLSVMPTTRMKIPRSSLKKSAFARYLNKSTLNELYTNTKIRNENKENISTINEDILSKKKRSERDSLGLIPHSYLDYCDDFDDVFLLNPGKNEHSFVKTSFNSSLHSNSNSSLELLKDADSDIFQKLCDDERVKENLKNLLYKNNRHFIIKNCRKVYETLLDEIRSSTLECNKLSKENICLDQNDVINLYYLHVKNELEKDKLRTVLKKLQENVKRRKEDIYSYLSVELRNRESEQRYRLDLQIEEAALITANNFLRHKIHLMKKIEPGDELQVLSTKIKKIKEEIFFKVDRIRSLVEIINKLLELIKINRQETSLCVKSVTPYAFNLSIANRLKEELISKEIEVFGKFPLEYNRRFLNNNVKCFYRDVCNSTLPSYLDVDSDNLEMVTVLMDTPFSTAESILTDVLRSKFKLNVLRSFQTVQPEVQNLRPNKYCFGEFHQSEQYVEEMINKLNCMINSSTVKHVLSAPNLMKEVVDLWMEMPLRNFIPEETCTGSQS